MPIRRATKNRSLLTIDAVTMRVSETGGVMRVIRTIELNSGSVSVGIGTEKVRNRRSLKILKDLSATIGNGIATGIGIARKQKTRSKRNSSANVKNSTS